MNPDDGFLFLSPSDIQKLQRYYQMLITTCHLQHLYEPEEILHQVLEKAREIVDSGQTIHNPYGWSRIVGKHIIFKGQREEIAQNKMCQKLITQFNDEVQQPLHQESIRDYYLSILRIALQELKQLSHEAYELLNLYFLQELSWEESISLEVRKLHD